MSQKDLETYEVQLSQVDEALTVDPDNAELTSLRSELKELIELTRASIAESEAAASSRAEASHKASISTPTHKWSAGDDCLAKYSGDNSWYPARITSVGGSSQKPVYSIVFKGYNSTEIVDASVLKALPPNYMQSAAYANKRKLTPGEEEERERKKRKNEKKLEVRAAKAKEQNQKQQTWQKFAKKADKKGVHIAGTSGTSIFKTPDNPTGRVGVTGSGKGMTEYSQMGKHKFVVDDDDN
ncbi:hypothetical protein PENSPDRAFT_664468 [Peniophora sp. CONT]|nr:hypothetical protein PENSPDRAFT_664468 [Peniophora sp. CONT]